jgi:hypothetical protein
MAHMTRTTLLLAAVAAALALGACGSGKDDNTGGSAAGQQDKGFDGALKFAKCMRDHGVDMADPTRTADGGIMMKGGGPGKDKGPDDPTAKKANDACAKYMEQGGGGGKAPDPAAMAKQRDAFVAYARCMRGKGINMPDPQVSGNGIRMTLGKGIRPDSPVFKAADTACHPLLAETEKAGPMGKKP